MDTQHTFTEGGDGWLDRRMAKIDLQRANSKLREEATRLTSLSSRQLIDTDLLRQAYHRVIDAIGLIDEAGRQLAAATAEIAESEAASA